MAQNRLHELVRITTDFIPSFVTVAVGVVIDMFQDTRVALFDKPLFQVQRQSDGLSVWDHGCLDEGIGGWHAPA